MKKIYIILTHTGTILSKIIKLFTQNRYTHVSISLDAEMNEMYSFGRLHPYNPFIGGFVKEGINIGTFKRFKNTESEVYSLEITDEEYEKIKVIIKNMYINKKIYKFNISGLAFALFRKRHIRKNKFYCSEFVRYLLENSNVHIKDISKVIKPEDFRKLKMLHLEYEGLLRKYDFNKNQGLTDDIRTLSLRTNE